MLFPAEILAGVSPLTAMKVSALDWILRQSVAYESSRARYSGVTAKLEALKTAPAVATAVDTSDKTALKAKAMDALLTLLPREVGHGTINILGGDAGKDYSQVRDREDLMRFALGVLFDEEEITSVDSNYVVILPRCGDCGYSCGALNCWKCRGYVS